jgi:putative NADH-flavin reductase
MKKVLIIGATGSLAQYVIDAMKRLANVELTLFVRNKNRLHNSSDEGPTVIEGDATNFDSVKNAVAGHDIVYVNLAGDLEAMAKEYCKSNEGNRGGKGNGDKLNRDLSHTIKTGAGALSKAC